MTIERKPDPDAVTVYFEMISALEEEGVENAQDVLTCNLIELCFKAGILKRPPK